MKYIIELNGKCFEVEVEKGQASAVYMGETDAVQEAKAARSAPASAPAPASPAAPAPAGAGSAVNAPMPGNILDVRVSTGQKVKAGDVLLILEAMKMENEIVAPTDGTVTSVCVTKGAVVETGTTLCTIA